MKPAVGLVAILLACAHLAAQTAPARRIVSLVPAVTQVLFAIGAGPQVVGVSSYDREPPEVDRLPRVGALLDPDLERILSLRPDLVVSYGSQAELREQLARTGIATYPYTHGGLANVTTTIRDMGRRTGREADAERLAASIARELEEVRRGVAGRKRPTVLLVFGRDPQALRNVYASGGVGFLHDLLIVAGGANVMHDVAREGLQVSTEQVLARAPEVILEIRAEGMFAPAGDRRPREMQDAALKTWGALPAVPAVRSRRVHVLVGADLVVPGPYVARTARLMAEALHGR